MAQPVWITPVGSIGTIPNGIFFQQSLLASTPTVATATCTASSATTNLITCNSTQGIFAGLNVMFSGNVFGGINNYTRYFVLAVIDATHFSISVSEKDTVPMGLTNGAGLMPAAFDQHTLYKIIAGNLPNGIQCSDNGLIIGIPDAVASLQGVPLAVGADTTSKFTVRAYTSAYPGITANIADRTFTLTIVVAPGPAFVTPAGEIGVYYDSDYVYFLFQFVESYSPDTTLVELFAGQLPGGLTLNTTGLLAGYIQPTPNAVGQAGFDLTPEYTKPYDFLSQSISKNFQFTLKVTNGKNSDLRSFNIFVYSRDQMTADDSVLIDNNTYITADETNLRAPFLVNSNYYLGDFRSNNYFAYQFIGENYNPVPVTYAISVNQGIGLPPGIVLDSTSGWYYGYIPDQGATQVDYSFNVSVYQSEYIGMPISCTATQVNINNITCNDTSQLGIGQPIVFTGTAFGGVVAADQVIYYVKQLISTTEFKISTRPDLLASVALTTASGTMYANLILSSQAYPFSLTITGAVDAEVTWTTDTDLGTINNGSTSILQVHAVNRGGRPILYRLANGSFNSLPQGLELLPSGQIAGRTSFDIFGLDLGLTTVDKSIVENRNFSSTGTTFDSIYKFTVNAYAPDTNQLIYKVDSVRVVNAGSGYNPTSPPTVAFSTPVGATAAQALPGTVAVVSGSIANVVIANQTGEFECDSSTALFVGVKVTVNGTMSGSGTIVGYTNPGIYYIISTNGLDVFTLSSTPGGTAIATTTGTTTLMFTPTNGILSVAVAEKGNGYTGNTGQAGSAIATITQGFGGSGAILQPVMKVSGSRDVVSVFKTFTIKVLRAYNKPYQNLNIQAMAPASSRALIRTLLDNTDIFPPEYIYRPGDPNFGKSQQVTYAHAFGLAPDTFEHYVSSLYLNHYWKQLVLGQIETAQALDHNGNIIYEVVYSRIIDNLTNNAGDSVNKIIALPYAIIDPTDGSTIINSVYPNSLVNMRNQVIDVVGQISPELPIWMTSKQTNGRVLGFVPAWVIAYTQPMRSAEIAYFIQTQFGNQLNQVHFDVDRYILDRALSRNWDPQRLWYLGPPESQVLKIGNWTPTASLTTFDRFNTGGYNFVETVTYGTDLAFADINKRTVGYINNLGGIDGVVTIADGMTLIFVKQEDYSNYAIIDGAWQNYAYPFDTATLSGNPGSYDGNPFDQASTIPTAPVDQRMAIYTIRVDINNLVSLVLTKQTSIGDYVPVTGGNFYRSAQLYYPAAPGEGLFEISWLPLITVITTETVFDFNSLKFVEPVDMYNPTDVYDKYLVFPKQNILV